MSGSEPVRDDPSAWFAGDPARPFLATPDGRRLTYGDLERDSRRLAATLLALGAAPGERVALQVEKSADAVLLYAACLRLGAVILPLNTAYTPRELDYFIADARPRVAIVRPADLATLEPLARRHDVVAVETLGPAGDGSLLERTRRSAAPAVLPAAPAADALGALLYTSGTTGRAKGAMLTRGNLAANAAALAAAWRFTADDVLLHALPLFHVHGLFISLNTVLAAGAQLLLLPRFDASEVLERLRTVTVLMGVPTYYTRLLQLDGLNRATTSAIRLFVSGSAPLLAETHAAFQERTGHAILERYGMTETLVNASHPYDGARLPGTVGPALPGVALRATQDGRPVAPGEIGMLEVRGPNVFRGYWNATEKTAEAFTSDGYFVTGDLGTIDGAGYVRIVGRAKDLVISGGYNVYPKEVETELDALPGVLESAVFGVPHADLGEAVTAAVVLEPGATFDEATALAALKDALARYKIPRRILVIAELPRNAMGKVQKTELRAAAAGLYGPSAERPPRNPPSEPPS